MGEFQCFERLHICSLLLCIFTYILHKDSSICLQKCYFAKSKQHLIHVQKIKSDMSITVQRDATIHSSIIFLQTALHVSDYILIHHQKHTQTVITASGTGRTVFITVRWSGGVGTADGSKYGSTSARCCNYSLSVLLMMDEGFIRNM